MFPAHPQICRAGAADSKDFARAQGMQQTPAQFSFFRLSLPPNPWFSRVPDIGRHTASASPLTDLDIWPAADPHLQGHRVLQMKIRITAEPALASLNGQVFLSGGKGRAALPGPHACAWSRGGQGFPPAIICFTVVSHGHSSFDNPS